MNRTVFCTFDQSDLADIAIGKLRAAVPRIDSISYLDHRGHDYANESDFTMMAGMAGSAYAASNVDSMTAESAFVPLVNIGSHGMQHGTASKPSRPVTVKITCDDSVQQKVVSKLVNLHAYRIVAT